MQGELFDTDTPKTRPAKPPGWVVDRLVRFGVTRSTAEKWHAGQAFAVLRRYETAKDPKATAEARNRDLSRQLRAAAAKEDVESRVLHDLINEALASLDSPLLAELATVTAAILVPPEPASGG